MGHATKLLAIRWLSPSCAGSDNASQSSMRSSVNTARGGSHEPPLLHGVGAFLGEERRPWPSPCTDPLDTHAAQLRLPRSRPGSSPTLCRQTGNNAEDCRAWFTHSPLVNAESEGRQDDDSGVQVANQARPCPDTSRRKFP